MILEGLVYRSARNARLAIQRSHEDHEVRKKKRHEKPFAYGCAPEKLECSRDQRDGIDAVRRTSARAHDKKDVKNDEQSLNVIENKSRGIQS